MLLLNGHIEEVILVHLLEKGPKDTASLFEHVQRQSGCTRQGFYRSLRKLRREERIAIYRSVVTVNELWLRRLRKLVSPNESASFLVGDIKALDEGEKLTLAIRGLSNMDRLWSHAFSIVEQAVSPAHPLFLYNPHNWSALLRPDTDRVHEQVWRERKRPAYLQVGSESNLDKAAYQSARFEHLEVAYNPKVRHECYIAVLNDYVFELRFTPKTRTAIHEMFLSTASAQEGRALLERMDRSTVCKITIERNQMKASEWRKRIARDFYIPKQYRVI